VSASPDLLEPLFRPVSRDAGFDQNALAGLLLDLAQHLSPDACVEVTGIRRVDQRLEQLRALLLGREIDMLSRLRDVVESPEQLAVAVGRILPVALAQASRGVSPVLLARACACRRSVAAGGSANS
jgi:OOP family OmpA-OmpF porin